MARLTRRGFLKSASIGGVTVGILATAPELGLGLTRADAAGLGGKGVQGPLVAYIHDTSKSEISLLVGTQKVVIRDRKLVERLIRAAN